MLVVEDGAEIKNKSFTLEIKSNKFTEQPFDGALPNSVLKEDVDYPVLTFNVKGNSEEIIEKLIINAASVLSLSEGQDKFEQRWEELAGKFGVKLQK